MYPSLETKWGSFQIHLLVFLDDALGHRSIEVISQDTTRTEIALALYSNNSEHFVSIRAPGQANFENFTGHHIGDQESMRVMVDGREDFGNAPRCEVLVRLAPYSPADITALDSALPQLEAKR